MTIERNDIGIRMSQSVSHGGLVYLSGQIPDRAEGTNCAEQSQDVLAKVDRILAQAGSGRDRILIATIYLKSMADFATFNAAWDDWIDKAALPARACVEANLAHADWLVEVAVTAAIE